MVGSFCLPAWLLPRTIRTGNLRIREPPGLQLGFPFSARPASLGLAQAAETAGTVSALGTEPGRAQDASGRRRAHSPDHRMTRAQRIAGGRSVKIVVDQ